MAKPELGEKRLCLSCNTKYYDLNRDPIVCPKCGAVFEIEELTKPEDEKVAEPAEKEEVAEEAVDTDGPEIISLEDAEEDNDDDATDEDEIPAGIPDVEVDDETGEDDDTFLDDDDDDEDDMSDIIPVSGDEKEDI
ncbi:MAG: TIGR02300 family protein [Pseudomonadota bacterium]